MKVLLFTASEANYKSIKAYSEGYNGGGWITSLLDELLKHKDITLGVCFCKNNEPPKVMQDGVTYYPISHHIKPKKDKVFDFIHYNDKRRDENIWPYYIKSFRQVIEDFKPDIVEIFGSELYIGLAAMAAKDYPCVLHIQGLLSLSLYIYMPPGISKWQYYWKDKSIKKAYSNFQTLVYWQRSCHREKAILKSVNNIIGRTNWDKSALQLLSPDSIYHYGSEVLRPEFYEPSERKLPPRIIITTTISNPLYKGYDLLLKIANILKNELHLNFEWNVFGNISPKFIEHHEGLKHEELNVNLCGVASAKKLREALLGSTLYVHPSYIENSPNSVSEAQILGIPVVSTNVGGISSLVEEGVTGILFPATDPYMGAHCIAKLSLDKQLNQNIGLTAKKAAAIRHNREKIVDELIETYKGIIG